MRLDNPLRPAQIFPHSMKTCSYCGRENPDSGVNCAGCGQRESKVDTLNSGNHFTDRDWVYLIYCPRIPYSELILTKLTAAGIEAFVPSPEEFEKAGLDSDFDIGEDGFVWIYVHLADYPAAKKYLPEPEQPQPASRARRKTSHRFHGSQSNQ